MKLYEHLDLTAEERSLLGVLRSLCTKLRSFHWNRSKRISPFTETLFERYEKGNFLGLEEVTLHDSVVMNGDIHIGEKTHVGQHCNLDGSGGLRIGRYCTISAGVRIMTHDTVLRALSGGRQPIDRSPVSIGDNCFIGANCVVTSGVTIGHHCVVAAGAVVTRDVPPLTIVAGVPARFLGKVVENPDQSFSLKYD